MRVGLDHAHGDARIRKAHRDAAAHRARADDRDLLHLARGDVGRDAWDFGDFAFAQERVAKRGGLRRRARFEK